MALHSSAIPTSVRVFDMLISIGILGATVYLFMARLDYVRTAELENETGVTAKSEEVDPTPTKTNEVLTAPEENTSTDTNTSTEKPKTTKKEKPATKAKATPTTPSPVVSPNTPTSTVTRNSSAYRPRGFNRRGFSH